MSSGPNVSVQAGKLELKFLFYNCNKVSKILGNRQTWRASKDESLRCENLSSELTNDRTARYFMA